MVYICNFAAAGTRGRGNALFLGRKKAAKKNLSGARLCRGWMGCAGRGFDGGFYVGGSVGMEYMPCVLRASGCLFWRSRLCWIRCPAPRMRRRLWRAVRPRPVRRCGGSSGFGALYGRRLGFTAPYIRRAKRRLSYARRYPARRGRRRHHWSGAGASSGSGDLRSGLGQRLYWSLSCSACSMYWRACGIVRQIWSSSSFISWRLV